MLLDLERTPMLRAAGDAVAIVDPARGVNLIVACTGPSSFVAIDRTCTHGGAQCTYNHKRRSLQCTSLNHAEYDLNGKLLHGRTHGDLRTYPAVLRDRAVEIEWGSA
ncbi:MAG: Rieske 2Fe-2S domain-containing protein [Bryobacterales bacterium]|nr:Rieske 2Fe-2S domain-containing protein [Bryobacterales bacterium]